MHINFTQWQNLHSPIYEVYFLSAFNRPDVHICSVQQSGLSRYQAHIQWRGATTIYVPPPDCLED